jgi:hypothetical protein
MDEPQRWKCECGFSVAVRRLAGGWCRKPIARHLRDQGHNAYPVLLASLRY